MARELEPEEIPCPMILDLPLFAPDVGDICADENVNEIPFLVVEMQPPQAAVALTSDDWH